MKIAFIGTHGTGKTTLAHELVSKLKKKGFDAGFLSEVARNCPLKINEDTTKKAQIWIMLNQITKEIESEEHADIVVSDRSVLDGYCYYVNKFGRSKVLEPLIIEHLKTYDYLIRVPIRQGFLKKDKIRSVSKDFQEKIDNQFNKLLKLFKLKTLKLIRTKTDKEIIESVLNQLD